MSPFSFKNIPQSSQGSQASVLPCSAAVKPWKKAEAEQLRHLIPLGPVKDQSKMTFVLLRTSWDSAKGVLDVVCGW